MVYNQASLSKFVNSFQAADAWGIECLRYEIRDIRMPHRVQEAMQMQVGKFNIATLILLSNISILSCIIIYMFAKSSDPISRLKLRGKNVPLF